MQTQKPVKPASGLSVDAKRNQLGQYYKSLPTALTQLLQVLQVLFPGTNLKIKKGEGKQCLGSLQKGAKIMS